MRVSRGVLLLRKVVDKVLRSNLLLEKLGEKRRELSALERKKSSILVSDFHKLSFHECFLKEMNLNVSHLNMWLCITCYVHLIMYCCINVDIVV